MPKAITYIDLFSGIGGFREGLSRAGGFVCVGHCEIDKYADQSYRALFDTKGEWFREDVREADPDEMPDFDLLCGGFPCQSFSIAGHRGGFADPRGTLFFEIARLTAAKRPAYLLLENVPGLLNHDGGRTFGGHPPYAGRIGVWCGMAVLNSKDFGVPQSRKRVYLVGYLDERCRGKILPFTETAGTPLKQNPLRRTGGARLLHRRGKLYPCGAGWRLWRQDRAVLHRRTHQRKTRKRILKWHIPATVWIGPIPPSIPDAAGVGRKIAHTITTGSSQGTLCCVDMNEEPELTDYARCPHCQAERRDPQP